MDYYEYKVRMCLALLYPPQALICSQQRTGTVPGRLPLGLVQLEAAAYECRVIAVALSVEAQALLVMRQHGTLVRRKVIP